MITNNESKLVFVTIGEREYSRMKYASGECFYTVKTNRLDQHCRYVWRAVNHPVTQARIDAAIEEQGK
ncbi:hypothetical protein FDJ47_gp30 [Enterobacter phage Ec_L1]|uniref:Uncharacterized protein n=1 Tax=Enterobacter phage Ec_L1 TaxID=2070180 RepID=A0A2P0W9V7_9CAUD|nr:hypothetical protein FDJ47_gp30 [Enterobacter phage Ec_L1]AUV57144.1 hypothetical protein Ec30 [Enterobacter phage Ec_L1]